MNIVWNILCTNHHNIVAVLSLQRERLARRHFEISGADPGGGGGGGGGVHASKLEKIDFFGVKS